jgi:hypothetical protein
MVQQAVALFVRCSGIAAMTASVIVVDAGCGLFTAGTTLSLFFLLK